MLTMTADRWIFLFAVCFKCVSADDDLHFEDLCEQELCDETHTLSASLGSSVLLPCRHSNGTDRVSWVHMPGTRLVQLTPEGRVEFLDPRYGRVKAFPNQGSEGNYSISIDELHSSDLGCYHCQCRGNCIQVQLVTGKATLSTALLTYICVGVGAFILLGVSSYYCKKLCWNNAPQNNMNNPVSAGTEGASAPPMETGRGQGNGHQRGDDHPVYENDDQSYPTRSHSSLPGVPYVEMTHPPHNASGIYPNLNNCPHERTGSRRSNQWFHRELLSRFRQASFSRHYYVNQDELRRQQATSAQAEDPRRADVRKKRDKENFGYKNPIYNRGTD